MLCEAEQSIKLHLLDIEILILTILYTWTDGNVKRA